MANISLLPFPYFADGSTNLNAQNLNPIIAKMNEVITELNGGSPTPTPTTVATPTISISGSTATISCTTSGATIRYTINGTPTESSGTIIASGGTVDLSSYPSGTIIRAIAYKSGMTTSQVKEVTYSPASSLVDITSRFTAAGWTTGAISLATGEPATTSFTNYCYCGFVDVSDYQGKVLQFTNMKLTASPGNIGLCFYDTSENWLKANDVKIDTEGDSVGYIEAKVLIPSNAKYVRLTWWDANGSHPELFSSFSAKVDTATLNETDITSQFTTWADGGLHYSDGEINSSSIYKYSTNYVDISAHVGKLLRYSQIKRDNTNSAIGIIFYDSSQAYLSGEKNLGGMSESGWQDTCTEIPSNAKYLRITWYKEGSSADQWVSDLYVKILNLN